MGAGRHLVRFVELRPKKVQYTILGPILTASLCRGGDKEVQYVQGDNTQHIIGCTITLLHTNPSSTLHHQKAEKKRGEK